MIAANVLTLMGPAMPLIETVPRWGPVMAALAAVLLYHAARMTWGTAETDTVPAVPEAVPATGDGAGDTLGPGRVTCGDSCLHGPHRPGTGGS
ncbi:hypothetical protein [Streptomyces alfalfae]